MKVKILSTKDYAEWIEILTKVEHDIYFIPEYARIYELNYGSKIDEAFFGKSFLFCYKENNNFVILPFTLREINTLLFLSESLSADKEQRYYDLISPYGYNGPAIKCDNHSEVNQLVNNFLSEFNQYCLANNIVTSFIRFHPLLNNQQYFLTQLNTTERNKTVYVDLTKTQDQLFNELNKKTRNLIRKAKKNGVSISISTDEQDLKQFTKLYLETMHRNKAQEKYFFPYGYYKNTFKFLSSHAVLFIAKHQGKIISASVFLGYNQFFHYHSGSDFNSLSLAPNNLLIWEAILWSKKNGYKWLHLGGGLRENDSLFHFKSGFSSCFNKFYTANIIHNLYNYEMLNSLKAEFEAKRGKKRTFSDFFPKYREIL